MCSSASNTTVSPMLMQPRSGAINPAIMLASVVLPAPDGPNNAVAPLLLAKRARRKKSPSRFSTSRLSMLFPVETHAGAACQPFGRDQSDKRDRDRDHNQAQGRRIAVGRLRKGV